jgi:hypothetical protein
MALPRLTASIPVLLTFGITLSAATLPTPAFALEAVPKKAQIEGGQIKLACKYFLKNAQVLAENVGSWLKYHLQGKKTPDEEMRAAFKRYPELYESLRVTEGRRFAAPGNQLLTFNTEEDMANVAEKTVGFCYGHATTRVYLQRLALFDPTSKFVKAPSAKHGSPEWVKFYYDRVFKLLTEEEPQVIPGYKNLEEFSSDPVVADWIRHAEARIWARRAAKIKNIWYRFNRQDMTREYSHRLVADLQDRLDAGMNPIIMFNENPNKLVKGWKDSMHVVTVVNLRKMENGKTAIIILDDKKPCGASGKDCYDVLILNPNGRGGKAFAYFDAWRWKNPKDHSEGAWDTGMGTVNNIMIVTENDRQYMRFAMNWADFCKKKPQICEELGDSTAHPAPIVDLPEAHAPYKEFKYVLGADGTPAPVDRMNFELLKKTGLVDELVEARKKQNKKK